MGVDGPVLTQTDLYLLGTELQINPILQHEGDTNFHLVFNLSTGTHFSSSLCSPMLTNLSPTGQTGGFNNEARDRDLPFIQKDEPAVLPRVTELILITELSPWCTTVRNDHGVTMSDVCTALWKEYTENYVTDAEFAALTPRLQEQVKRAAQHNAASMGQWGGGYYGTPQPNRFRRIGMVYPSSFLCVSADYFMRDRLAKREGVFRWTCYR